MGRYNQTTPRSFYGEISETECEARMLTPVYSLPLNDYVGCEVE